jgi:O-antigen/teichoic acid export membrane protein
LDSSHLKKIFSDSVIYGFGNIINRLLGFLLLPLHTYFFKPAEYGTFSLIYSFGFFAAVFYLFGMETSFQKYFIESKEPEHRRKIFSTTLILLFCTSFVFSFIIYLLSNRIAFLITGNISNGYLVKLLSLLLFIDVLSRFPMILINSLQLSKVYTYINVGGVIVNIASNLVLIIGLGMRIEAIFYALIISYLFMLVVSFIYCLKYFHFSFDKSKVKTLVKFAHSFLYYGIFLIILDQADKFIIQYFDGSREVGIYTACYRIGMIMNLVISGFRTAWIPFFLNLKEEENNKEVFSKVFSYFVYGAMLFFLAVALFGTDIVEVKFGGFSLLNEKYWNGMTILPFILLSYFFFGLFTNVNIASYFENKIKYLIISSGLGALSNIIFNFILIPRYSIIGAAVSTMLSYFIMFVSLYYFSQKVYFITYEWKKIYFVIILSIALYLVNVFIQEYFVTLNLSLFIVYLIKLLSLLILLLVLFTKNFIRFTPKNTV